MFKIKKKIEKPKPPILYNVIEDYSEFDAPGNVTACAMTLPEDQAAHAKILAESYDVPLEQMTRGLFACRIDTTGATPKQTWVLDLMQFAEAEQWARLRAVPLIEAATEVFYRTLPEELKTKLAKKNLGLDYRTLDRAVAKGGDIKFIDFRKDWSPHFKRLCIMPDGRLVETGGLEEFAQLHQITVSQAKKLVEEGGTMDVAGGEVLACQIVNGQPAVARFSAKNYTKAKELAASKGLHILDALSEVAYNDSVMMRTLQRKDLGGRI